MSSAMTLEQIEQDKYERMWAQEAYHINSPGLRICNQFLNRIPWNTGDSILDAGCGTGRVSKTFAHAGLSPYLLDFVDARDEDVRHFPFIKTNLWSMKLDVKFAWIYCVDVLEHIPPEHVEDVISKLAMVTHKGGLLQIACFQDGCGKYIGETLHLTVENPAWWETRVSKYFNIVEDLSDSQYALYQVRSK